MCRRLSAFQTNIICFKTPTYFPKYLVPILELSTPTKYTVNDLFNFATEINEQNFSNFIRNLDIGSRFTNIPFEGAIKICTNNLVKTTTSSMV